MMCRFDRLLRLILRLSGACLLAAEVLAHCGLAAAPGAPLRLPLSPCKLAGLEREVRCGTFEVFEDRHAGAGRRITLHVAVLPATGPERAADPLFYFNGGPGESAIESAAGIAQSSKEILRRRDIVLVDLRGTGASNGLGCKALQGHEGVLGYLESFLPVAGVRACRKELEPRADLRLYTTTLAVDDLEDVRAALGYDRINLIGGSHGTFAALTFIRRHGEHVRTAVLQGVVPPNTRAPLSFARDAQVALDQLIAACRKDAACLAAFPDPAADVARVLATLEKAPAEASVRDDSGKPVKVVLSRNAAAQTIRYMLYLPVTAAQIPLQMRLAAKGDYTPLAETAYLFGGLFGSVAEGYYLSVTCAEDVASFDLARAEEAARGTFLGDFRARAQKAACAEWPRGLAPPGFEQPVRSNVPTLLISGERDPVTPSSAAERAARTLPRSLRVVVPGAGHSTGGLKGVACLERIVTDFVEKGDEKRIDTRCVARIEPVPFLLRDERAAGVTLTSEELDRFAGRYVAAAGDTEVAVRRESDVLLVETGEGKPFALAPIGPSRFKVLGAPAGFFIEFEPEGGSVSALVFEEGPNGRETLRRKKVP